MLKKGISFLRLTLCGQTEGVIKVRLLNTQSALIGQLTHAWANIAYSVSRWLWLVSGLQLPSLLQWIWANVWHDDVIKSLPRDLFQELCFLVESRAPVGADFGLFYFQDVLNAQELM